MVERDASFKKNRMVNNCKQTPSTQTKFQSNASENVIFAIQLAFVSLASRISLQFLLVPDF